MSFEAGGDGREKRKEESTLLHHRVTETSLAVLFEFEFDQPLSDQEASDRCAASGSDVNRIVTGKLQEKGWLGDDGAERVPMQANMRQGRDGRIWRFEYILLEPGQAGVQ